MSTTALTKVGTKNAEQVVLLDAAGDQVSSFGGGTQYADGATAATPTGTQINWNDAGTQRAVSAAKPLPVSVTGGGDATAANQVTGNNLLTTIDADTGNIATSVSSIDTKTPALGQALAAASVPVVLPAAQITTLTPPAAITGFATETTLGSVKTAVETIDNFISGSRGLVTEDNSAAIKTSVELIDDAIKADDAAFTPATTKVMMAGFEFDDVAPDSVDEGDAGAARMSANRNIYTTIRDAAGNERGANVDANGALAAVVTQGTATNLKTQAEAYQGGSAVAAGNPLQVTLANTGANTTAVKTNVASGGIASGAIASGAVASGAVASGAFASGSISDGADVTFGAKTDAKSTATDATSVTAMQVLKQISASVQAPPSQAVTNAGTFAIQDSEKVADNAGFTDGTTKVLPVGFIYDEVAGTALTENDAAAARINANRAVVGTIEDGSTRGRYATVTASNALKVDGSAVTQPVSGTFWQTTQPVSGTVTANLAAGTNNIGDVDVLTVNGIAPAFGTGTRSASVQRVTIATDDVVPAAQSGTWNITNVSGTVSLPTGASTLAEQQSQTTSLQLIDDVVYTDDTSTHATGTSKGIGIMATATPTDTSVNANDIGMVAMTTDRRLLVDASGVAVPITDNSGSITVDQPTGSNLHTVVDSGTVTTVSTVTNLSQMGGVAISLNTGVRDTGTQRVTIATNDVVPASQSGTWTVQPGNTANTTAWKVDGSAVTQPVSIATNTPVGNIAHDSADSGAPIKVGGRARSSEITAVASDDRSDFVTDLTGKQIVLPYANPENFVSGAITTAMTGTTSTSLVAAPAAGLRNYLTTIIVSNAHATVGTDVVIQDGSGGTTLLTIPAASVYGGAVINLPVPLRQPTTATAIYCANVTTGASTKVSAVGYKGV